jgi:hypothetical protein
MEIIMTTGVRYFLRFVPLAALSEAWSERVRTAPTSVRRLRAGRPFHAAPTTSTCSDLPVTDRMRRSASEP